MVSTAPFEVKVLTNSKRGGDALAQDELAVLGWVENQAGEMTTTVRDWAAINSGSRNRDGLEAMRARLAERFAVLGGVIDAVELPASTIVTPDGATQDLEYTPSFRLTQRPDAPIQIVLTGHHDTVFPADSAFQSCRDLDADTLNGPGVADMKGGLLVMATALEALERSPWRDEVGYTVLVSPDEEIGSPGSSAELARLGAQAHLGMTYEPALADGSLAGARKGSGNFAVALTGRAAHAGREHHLGRNALEAAAHLIIGLQGLNGQRDGVTVNVAKVDGGGALNVVPDTGVVRFNVRLQEPEDADWLTDRINELVARAGARDGIGAALHGGFTRPPKPMAPPNAELFSWTKETGALLGQEISWVDTGGVCEGNNLWASGCPNVDTLGVRGGSIHSQDEFAILSSFPERAMLSALLLMRIARGVYDARALRTLSQRGR